MAARPHRFHQPRSLWPCRVHKAFAPNVLGYLVFPAESCTTDDPEFDLDKESSLSQKRWSHQRLSANTARGLFCLGARYFRNLDTLDMLSRQQFLMDLIMAPDWIHAVMPKLLGVQNFLRQVLGNLQGKQRGGSSSMPKYLGAGPNSL